MSVGYQYGEDTAEQHDFEMDFHELTPDQAKSIEEIMERTSTIKFAMWRCKLRKNCCTRGRHGKTSCLF